MTNPNPNSEYWQKVAVLLNDAVNTIPIGDEPEAKIYYPHPDEDWKNQEEKAELESQYYEGTSEYLRQYFIQLKWNGRVKAAIPYYAEQRLMWAVRFLKSLLTRSPTGDRYVIPAALIPPNQFLSWLVIDAYARRLLSHR